jgi:hypothetical protein
MTFPRVRATSVLATTAKYLLHLFHFVPIEVTSHVWTTKGTERERELELDFELELQLAWTRVVRGSCSSCGERFREGIATVSGCSGPSGPCFVWALEDSSSCAWTHQTRALPELSPPWPSCVKNPSLRTWQKGWRQGTRQGISEGNYTARKRFLDHWQSIYTHLPPFSEW